MKPTQQVVLVVEDFEDNRFMLRKLLEMAGYQVIEATDGEQAIVLAKQQQPALILMDLSLPRLDGLAATRQIRQHTQLSRIPIIAVSAHDSTDFHTEALAAGCNEYVSKPIDFEQLDSLIKSILPEN